MMTFGGLGFLGVYVNLSIVDEVVIISTNPMHVDDSNYFQLDSTRTPQD